MAPDARVPLTPSVLVSDFSVRVSSREAKMGASGSCSTQSSSALRPGSQVDRNPAIVASSQAGVAVAGARHPGGVSSETQAGVRLPRSPVQDGSTKGVGFSLEVTQQPRRQGSLCKTAILKVSAVQP